MARANAQPATSIAWLIITLGVVGIGVAIYFGYPGMAALWLAVVAAGWAEPHPVFTGPKDAYGAPTPQGPRETKAKGRYLLLNQLKWRMVMPNGDWLPGWPPLASWFIAVAAGALATALPADDWWGPWVNAGATFILIATIPGAKRRTGEPVDPHPGVRVNSLGQLKSIRPVIIGALAVFVLVALVVLAFMGGPLAGQLDLPLPGIAYALSLATLGAIGVCWPQWQMAALTQWRERVASRKEWEVRWQVAIPQAAKTGSPTLVSHRMVGGLRVDTFDAPPTLGAPGLLGLKPKINQAIGGGYALAMLATPNLDSTGAPMPGTEHPLRVDVVTYPTDSPPNITDPATSQEEAAYMVTAALSQAVDAFGGGGAQYIFIDIEAMHVAAPPDDSPTGWARLWAGKAKAAKSATGSGDEPPAGEQDTTDDAPDDAEQAPAGPQYSAGAVWAVRLGGANTMGYARKQYAAMMPGYLGEGTEVIVNDWPAGSPTRPEGERLFAGALTDPGTIYADDNLVTMLSELMEEDAWNARWGAVLKTGANQPEPQFVTSATSKIRSTELNSLAFTIKQGEQVDAFEKLEPKLATTLMASPFVSVVGYPGPGGRPGDRHPQAFAVRWSNGPVPPSADRLPPSREVSQRASTITSAEHWVLAGQLNSAFDAAKLARPEVMSVRPLTRPGGASGHIWQVEARMYGGVGLAEVRSKMSRLMSTLSVPWMQVTPADQPQVLVFVLGADYRKARLANPEQDLPYLADLEWQQAWVDAKLISSQGLTPTTIATTPLPTNDKVLALDFELPSGITRSRIKGSVEKLKGSTRNEFVEVRPGEHGPNSVRLLVSPEDPMPFPAPIDFDYVHSPDAAGLIPFATGVEGEPISWNIEEDVHLLLVGGSGSGKSGTVQMLLYPMIERGWEVHIADPVKVGADFRFAEPWLKSMTFTVEETSAMMDAVYTEVKRRRSLNGEHGVGSYRDLPEEVRPPHSVIIIDEFTSLILADKPRKPATSDPDSMAAYEEAVRIASLVGNIGDKVGRITREARSAGVTLVLATQRLTAKELESIPGGNTIRTNMSRMLLGKSTFGERQSALKDPESAPELGDVVPQGRGLLETSGRPIRIIQSWYDHPIDEKLTAKLSERVKPLSEDEKLDLEPFMPKVEEMVVEGAVLDAGTSAPAGGEVTELDAMEIDLEDLELPGEDFSDLDLGDLEYPSDDDDDTEEPEPVPTLQEIAAQMPTLRPGEPVLATDDPQAAAALGIATLWLGEAGDAPPGAQVAGAGDGGLLGHAHLDALADLLDAAAAAPSHLVWVSPVVSDSDDLGTPLGETVDYLASRAGDVPVLAAQDFDEAHVRDFLGLPQPTADQETTATEPQEADFDEPEPTAETEEAGELDWADDDNDEPSPQQGQVEGAAEFDFDLEEVAAIPTPPPPEPVVELGENEEEFSF